MIRWCKACWRLSNLSTPSRTGKLSLGKQHVRYMSDGGVMNVFDRQAKMKQRDRAAVSEDPNQYEYIKEEVGYRLADRIFDIKRTFKTALDLGCGRGHVAKHVSQDCIEKLIMLEMSEESLKSAQVPEDVPVEKLHLDEEAKLPFEDNSLDLVMSNLSLHWINDLPGVLRRVHVALKNDGVFLASMFGGQTLFQLRVSLMLAELEREGGFAAHVSPLTDVRDVGGLLQQAGFTMLTIDCDDMTVNYPSMIELMNDLRGMAENNASWNRKSHLYRDTMTAAAAIYQELYGNEDGSVPATFQIYYMIGWKPDPSQPKPAARGSATVSLKDLQHLDELARKKK